MSATPGEQEQRRWTFTETDETGSGIGYGLLPPDDGRSTLPDDGTVLIEADSAESQLAVLRAALDAVFEEAVSVHDDPHPLAGSFKDELARRLNTFSHGHAVQAFADMAAEADDLRSQLAALREESEKRRVALSQTLDRENEVRAEATRLQGELDDRTLAAEHWFEEAKHDEELITGLTDQRDEALERERYNLEMLRESNGERDAAEAAAASLRERVAGALEGIDGLFRWRLDADSPWRVTDWDGVPADIEETSDLRRLGEIDDALGASDGTE